MGRLLLPLALVLSVLVALTTGAAIKGSKSSLSFVSQLRLSQSLELLSSYSNYTLVTAAPNFRVCIAHVSSFVHRLSDAQQVS